MGTIVVLWIASITIDLLMTFVTPALAFSTYRARTAIRIGVSMIAQHWPATIGYILVPPLAILVVTSLFGTELSIAASVAVTILTLWVSLWFKGATARFYLRHRDVGENGAAFAAWEEREARLSGNPSATPRQL
jgi:hypothetical protein